MRYSYKCENGHNIELKLSINEDIPREISCTLCGGIAKRDIAADFKSSSTHIPDFMKACSITNRDNGANLSYLKNRMKNSPTGRRKIYYRGGFTK